MNRILSMGKGACLLMVSLFAAQVLSPGLSASTMDFTQRSLKLGSVELMGQGWSVERGLGRLTTAPEFVMPVQLVYSTQSDRSGLFGYQWHSPQLESRLTPVEEGKLQWKTPWGSHMVFSPGEIRGVWRESTGNWTLRSKGGERRFEVRRIDGWKFHYDNGRLNQVEAAGGRRLVFQYEAGAVKSIEQIAGGDRMVVLEAARDAKGRLTSLTLGGAKNEFTYTEAGRLAAWVRHGVEWESYSYTEQGVLGKTRNALGVEEEFVTEYRPPNFHRLPDSEKARLAALSAVGQEQEAIRHHQMVKDGAHTYERTNPWQTHVTKATDGQGRVWSADVSFKRGVLKMTDPEGKVTTTKFHRRAGLAYDWQPREVTDRNGRRLSYHVYDDAGNLTGVRDALGHWTLYTYNARKQPLTVSRRIKGASADETLARYSYDQHGRLVEVADAEGVTSKMGYNAFGDLESFTDAQGRVTRMNVNARGQVTSVVSPDGLSTHFRYDSDGRLTERESADGVVDRYAYDGQGRFIGSTRSSRHQPGVVIAMGQRAYDEFGRLVRVEDGVGRASEYEYDGFGRLAASIDGRGVRTVLKYDDARRLAGWYLEQVRQQESGINGGTNSPFVRGC
ncbi:hypothetical protein QPK87_30260 [Kamptonema cortianum]|nr:hypothetical protein [Kamptonema cortianum]